MPLGYDLTYLYKYLSIWKAVFDSPHINFILHNMVRSVAKSRDWARKGYCMFNQARSTLSYCTYRSCAANFDRHHQTIVTVGYYVSDARHAADQQL